MSVSFYIKNKKKFFGYEKVLTVGEVIDSFKEYKLSIYNIDFDTDDFNKEKFYNTSIENWQENHSCILFGVEGKSVRGFEFSYNTIKNSYVIREFTPASENDWLIVLEFMKVLSEKLNSKIVSEQREMFTSETISTFSYRNDIKSGIKVILDLLNKENEKGFNVDNIYGIKRPVSFNKEIIERIVNSSDEIKEFSKFCEDIQYIDAYSAKQFFVDDKKINKKCFCRKGNQISNRFLYQSSLCRFKSRTNKKIRKRCYFFGRIFWNRRKSIIKIGNFLGNKRRRC